MGYPDALLTAMRSINRKPIWIVEIVFNSGEHGSEGVNDIYIGSTDVSNIIGFPYPERYIPTLDIESISGLSQKLDLLSGVSSIGSISFKVQDRDNFLSDVIKAADAVNQGLRRQMVEIYDIESGGSWATDKQKIRTMKLSNVKQSSDGNWYTVTAHDVQSDMQGTVFEPVLTTTAAVMLVADPNFTLVDSGEFETVVQPVYGTVGFVKIEDEIIMWSSKTTSHVVTVATSGRGMFGTMAADHAIGSEVSEIIVLRGNPISIALQVLTSTGDGTNGTYDIYPKHWGTGLSSTEDINISEFELVAESVTGMTTGVATSGMQYQFVYDKSMAGKMFIESRIFKQIGVFSYIHGDGSYGLKPYSDLASAAKENAARHLTVNNIIKCSDLDMDLAGIVNDILVKYDEFPPLSGKFIRNARFLDTVSIVKHGRQKKPLVLKAEGVIPTSVEVDQLYQRIHMIGAQLSTPPRKFSLTLMPQEGDITVGEVVRITWPIRDAYTGNDLDIAAQVDSVKISTKTGEPQISVRAQHEKATFWQGGTGEVATLVISPASLQIAMSGTHQLTVRALDAAGNQLPLPSISWLATGNLSVNASGLVTAGASAGTGTVYAVAGSSVSNTVNIDVQAASANPVTSVVVSPSTIELQVGNTQQTSAAVLDSVGDATAYTGITWASDTPAVATVHSTTGVVTAVTNGTANIKATETGSAIESAPAVVSVVPVVVPTYQPPYLADVCYQVGTQITAHGPVGGPHVIPDGYNFASGDYWYDGDVSLATGASCTINGTVIIYSLGVVTINGSIDGQGRGGLLGGTVTGLITETLPGQPGYVGKGGQGGQNSISNAPGQDGGTTIYQGQPIVTVVPTSTDPNTGQWTAIADLPGGLHGSGAGHGHTLIQFIEAPYFIKPGDGGESGAGLLIMARGIYLTLGQIDLRGGDGQVGNTLPILNVKAGDGGGGGGGTFVGLAERDVNGLPVISVDPTRVLIDGGIGGLNGSIGGPGAKIIQVIG